MPRLPMSLGSWLNIESVSTVQISAAGEMKHAAVVGVDQLSADALNPRDLKNVVGRLAADRHDRYFIRRSNLLQIDMGHEAPPQFGKWTKCGLRAEITAIAVPVPAITVIIVVRLLLATNGSYKVCVATSAASKQTLEAGVEADQTCRASWNFGSQEQVQSTSNSELSSDLQRSLN